MIEYWFGIEQSETSTWTCDYLKSETRATYSSIFSTIKAITLYIAILIFLIRNDSISLLWRNGLTAYRII